MIKKYISRNPTNFKSVAHSQTLPHSTFQLPPISTRWQSLLACPQCTRLASPKHISQKHTPQQEVLTCFNIKSRMWEQRHQNNSDSNWRTSWDVGIRDKEQGDCMQWHCPNTDGDMGECFSTHNRWQRTPTFSPAKELQFTHPSTNEWENIFPFLCFNSTHCSWYPLAHTSAKGTLRDYHTFFKSLLGLGGALATTANSVNQKNSLSLLSTYNAKRCQQE